MWKHKVGFVSACNPYRDRSGRSDEEYVKDKADELERMFQEVGPDQVAAFIAEPVVGAVSVYPCYEPGELVSSYYFTYYTFLHSTTLNHCLHINPHPA